MEPSGYEPNPDEEDWQMIGEYEQTKQAPLDLGDENDSSD